MRKKLTVIVLIGLLFSAERAYSQHNNNILLYSNQATLFGDQAAAYDPVSIIIPGTAMKSGIGSFIDNPASMALYDKSIGEFGFSYGSIREDATYLENSRSLDNNQFNLSNAAFLYTFPAERGSFVIGAGYTKHTSFNRAFGFNARNESSTITDEFKLDGSPYQEIAYETYAVDYLDIPEECGWDGNQFVGVGCESIFRIGSYDNQNNYIPGDYLGIQQQGEVLQSGVGGEYSLFFATEFQKNLMFGASVGLLSGKFHYDRIFQEIDESNRYNSDIIDNNGGTDIDNILLDDNLTSRYNGFRARAGLLYKATNNLNIGVSYMLPTTLYIDEDFDASITTTFDNSTELEDSAASEFSYNVRYPGRLAIGVALQDLKGFSVSASTEYVNYANTEIEFDDSDLYEDEMIENSFIADTFLEVWSYRAGLAYDLTPEFTVRGGYSFKPTRFTEGKDDRTAYSFGAGFNLANGVRLEAAARYTTWDEISTVYDYGVYDYSDLPENLPDISTASEVANHTVDHWEFLGTLRVDL